MMSSSSKLKISTDDLESERENPFSLWTAGPSSPPFNHAPSIHKFNDSSPSTPSELEFEFGSMASLEIKDDPPVSPKLISSFATGYWHAAVSSFDAGTPAVMDQKITGAPVITPLSLPISSTKQPPAPPSPSVRQLMAEEMHSEHDDDFSLDFYSVPQTPLPTPPRTSATASKQSQDEPSLNIVTRVGRRKSNSAVLDRRAQHDDELAPLAIQKNPVLQSSKSESNSHYALWTSAFAWEKSEEEKSSSGVKKQGSKSGMKWAFKDLLRRTVPSSKAEAHYITNTMGASSSTKSLSSTKSNPNISPLASPIHSSSMSTPWSTRPSTPGQSPTSTPGRSSPRRPSTPGRTPAQTLNRAPLPSPPRSPLSPHAIHYQQNKAQSVELNRKTFLPYRQSLLGCLGGPGAFSTDQQVW